MSFVKRREAITWHYHKLTPCGVSKDKWDKKEDTGKSMKHALYVLRYRMPKDTRQEATLNSEKIKPVSLRVIELCLSEHNSQAVENSTK